jgi:hypothetical protein
MSSASTNGSSTSPWLRDLAEQDRLQEIALAEVLVEPTRAGWSTPCVAHELLGLFGVGFAAAGSNTSRST